MDYARALVEHPKWRWEPGMRYARKTYHYRAPANCEGVLFDASCVPCLDDPATKGWLLHMLREATGDQRAQTATRGNLFTGDIVWRCSAGSHLGVDGHATEGEALAAALLAVWGQAA